MWSCNRRLFHGREESSWQLSAKLLIFNCCEKFQLFSWFSFSDGIKSDVWESAVLMLRMTLMMMMLMLLMTFHWKEFHARDNRQSGCICSDLSSRAGPVICCRCYLLLPLVRIHASARRVRMEIPRGVSELYRTSARGASSLLHVLKFPIFCHITTKFQICVKKCSKREFSGQNQTFWAL